jgi:hypothetical protein
LEGRRDQRSPLRRCFKPRPPLSAGCAGFASGCRLSGSELRRPTLSPFGFESRPHSGRLSGLLSGCPPTGTRPQARAKLGERDIVALATRCKIFFAFAEIFSQMRPRMVTRSLPYGQRDATSADFKASSHPRRSLSAPPRRRYRRCAKSFRSHPRKRAGRHPYRP